MKWLFGKGSRPKAPGKNYLNRSIPNSKSQVTKLMVCLLGAGMFLSGDAARLKLSTVASASAQKTPAEIDSIAHKISVKVLDRDFLGSGFIVKRSRNKYIVITNQHVLRAGEAPYHIKTADGKIYPAKVADVDVTDRQYDLAILEFEADAIYPTATIGNSLYLEVGEPVFAAGFPYGELDTSELATSALFKQSKDDSLELALKQGRVVIILDRALEEGYQIGYTNDVRKGMSGGPLLNSRGEVIGVNGKHAYPLWESPEIYQDGQEPCPALQDLITRSSLAIPIEKSLESPQLKPLKLSNSNTRQSNLLPQDSQLINKMQLEAQRTIQSCQNPSSESSDRYSQPRKR